MRLETTAVPAKHRPQAGHAALQVIAPSGWSNGGGRWGPREKARGSMEMKGRPRAWLWLAAMLIAAALVACGMFLPPERVQTDTHSVWLSEKGVFHLLRIPIVSLSRGKVLSARLHGRVLVVTVSPDAQIEGQVSRRDNFEKGDHYIHIIRSE